MTGPGAPDGSDLDSRNAINPEMTRALDMMFNRVENEPALRVAILTGTSTVFSAGTDLRQSAGERTDRTDDGEAVKGARALADRIVLNAPVSVRESLLAARELSGWNATSGWDSTERAVAATRFSADAAEGISAFFERRPPRWSGR